MDHVSILEFIKSLDHFCIEVSTIDFDNLKYLNENEIIQIYAVKGSTGFEVLTKPKGDIVFHEWEKLSVDDIYYFNYLFNTGKNVNYLNIN
jgi:hypothetical protein